MLLAQINFSATVYEDIRDNCVLLILWQRIGEGLLKGVMLRCPHAFVHIVQDAGEYMGSV